MNFWPGTGGGSWALICWADADRKSTRLNSSHRCISYAVFCLKKKKRVVVRDVHHGAVGEPLHSAGAEKRQPSGNSRAAKTRAIVPPERAAGPNALFFFNKSGAPGILHFSPPGPPPV